MATLIIRPDGEGSTQEWDTRSSYSYIDDDVTQPSAPSGGTTDTCRNATTNATNEWTLGDVGAPAAGFSRELSSFRVWWYFNSNPLSTPFQFSVKVGGSWQTLSTANTNYGSWQYADFAVTTLVRTGLEVRCYSGAIYFGAYFDLDAVYVDVTYTDSAAGTALPMAMNIYKQMGD